MHDAEPELSQQESAVEITPCWARLSLRLTGERWGGAMALYQQCFSVCTVGSPNLVTDGLHILAVRMTDAQCTWMRRKSSYVLSGSLS